ncbi:MAG: TRAP transporter small permease, partial [Pseudomonadota bacterium]
LEGWVGKPLWGLFLLMVDSVILAFCLVLIWLSWIWYDPLTLMAVGFDTGAFSGQTFNYIYDEPTLTVGVAKFWIWMIMPITAMTMTIHAAYNLFCRTNTTSKQ